MAINNYLGQVGGQSGASLIVNSIKNSMDKQRAEKLALAQSLIKSGAYAPTQTGQQPGLLGRIGQGLLGPQVGGANMNVGGQNFQFQGPQQQAQQLQSQMDAYRKAGLIAPQGASVGSAGGSYPFQMTPKIKDGNLSMDMSAVDPTKQLTAQKDQLEIDKLKREAQGESSTPQIGNGVIDDGTKTQEQLLAEMKQKDPSKLTFYENLKAGNIDLGKRSPAKLLPIFQAMSSLYGKQFDQQAIAVRGKLKQDYSSAGKTSQNAVSLNTAIQHLSELQKIIPQLKDSPIKPWNKLMQTMGREFGPGSNVLAKYRAIKGPLSGELSNIYKRSGGTDSEIKNVADTLDSADSPEAQQASIEEAVKLLSGRLSQNIDGWKATFDLPDDPKLPSNIITARSRKALNEMGLGYIVDNTLKEDDNGTAGKNNIETSQATALEKGKKIYIKTGMYNGRKVGQLQDGTTEFIDAE